MSRGELEDVGSVADIFRFPVKSMCGERLSHAELTPSGVPFDRAWALRDVQLDEITSAKRVPELLLCTARLLRESEVEIQLPSGARFNAADDGASRAISEAVGRDLLLQALQPRTARRHYRLSRLRSPAELRRLLGVTKASPPPDMSDMPLALLLELAFYATPRGTYFDAFPLHLVSGSALRTVSSLSAVEATSQRFRPNIVIDTGASVEQPELEWCGHRLRIGEAELMVRAATFRCGMPSHAQAGLPKAPAIVRTVYHQLGTKLGVYAVVTRPGRISEGDRVRLLRTPEGAVVKAMRRATHPLKWALLRLYLRL
jgi:uncharacterized protein